MPAGAGTEEMGVLLRRATWPRCKVGSCGLEKAAMAVPACVLAARAVRESAEVVASPSSSAVLVG